MKTEKSEIAGYYPILISLKNFPCIVIGGGKIAYRKVCSLLEFNADITVVSTRFCKPLLVLFHSGQIKIIKKAYSKELIKDYKIAFSATGNSSVNKIIHKDCKEKGVLLNSADNPAFCDFILPANIKRGDLTISVSSQGKAPFYTKEIKKKLGQIFPPVYSDIIYLAGKFRKQLLLNDKVINSKDKEKIFNQFTLTDWENIFSKNGKKSSNYYVNKILKQYNL